jgi:hypothetical protein
MRYLRVAACLVALIFACASMATGAEVTYSGVPGKFKRGAKGAKASESAAADKETPKEKGKRTMTVPKPKITVTPGTPEKK